MTHFPDPPQGPSTAHNAAQQTPTKNSSDWHKDRNIHNICIRRLQCWSWWGRGHGKHGGYCQNAVGCWQDRNTGIWLKCISIYSHMYIIIIYSYVIKSFRAIWESHKLKWCPKVHCIASALRLTLTHAYTYVQYTTIHPVLNSQIILPVGKGAWNPICCYVIQ